MTRNGQSGAAMLPPLVMRRTAALTPGQHAEALRMAQAERRSLACMLAVLVGEAMAQRQRAVKP